MHRMQERLIPAPTARLLLAERFKPRAANPG
jgi:hypothetical protein